MDWKKYFTETILSRGLNYMRNDAVKEFTYDENSIVADVEGTESYHVEFGIKNNDIEIFYCDCPYAEKGNKCKHMAAVLFKWEKETGRASSVIEEHNAFEKVVPSLPTEEEIKEEEKKVQEKKAVDKIELSVDIDDVMNYAIQQNGVNFVNEVCIKNNTEVDFEDLTLKIYSDSELLTDFEMPIQTIRAGEEIHLRDLKVKVNGDYLASLTERVVSNIKVDILHDGKVIKFEIKEITALAFDEWPGLKYTPELLAAFSMPNHAVVNSLLQLASTYLEKWTGDPSLQGYQSDDPNRIKQMAAAAYAAIQQKNIIYANPPSSFEVFGQRIRLADAVLEQHMGTCLDMTLLYVACLEAMGLNPIMVLMHGHIFAGVWLVEDSFSDTIMDDPSHLEKRMAEGIHEILVVECTAMNAGKSCDFDKAVKLAENSVSNYGSFEFVIDVARARSMGIRPLPVRVRTDAGFEVQHQDRKDVTSAPTEVGATFDLSNLGDKPKATKQLQWERKLLDLSMRNMLINLRFTKAVVPLLCSHVDTLEDALTEGEEFQVLPRPDNMKIEGEGIPVEALTNLGPFQDFIELEGKHRKLHSFYYEKDLNSCLTKMYRSAKTSLEENGASTLYLALGLLRWVEGKKDSSVPRYAPIILIPIDITRKSATKGYTMRMRDEEAQINITLLEFLKQNYDIQIQGLNPLPTDNHGLDLTKIFAIIRHGIMGLHMWDVVEAGFIGNFSFSQFVMWNDIHSRSDILEKNKIVRSLINDVVDWDCTMPEGVDSDEAYLPIACDASQLRAINMAANGVSFVLHGPPGTGKSQTITAMIANALTKGKTVLFVAEKMAALEVVQRRLEALGIGDFCLELHSNKATKKAVLDQLKRTLEISAYGSETEYDQKIKDIRAMRADLDAYVEKLHEHRPFGKSLKELIDIYETIPDYGLDLRFTSEYACELSQGDLDNQKRIVEQLVAAGKGIGHPHNHPLSAINQTVYTQTLKMQLEDTVSGFKTALTNVKDSVGLFVEQFGIAEPYSEEDWNKIYDYAKSVVTAESIPALFFESDNIDRDFDSPLTFALEKDSFDRKQSALTGKWNGTFLQMDMKQYHQKYDDANKKLLGKGRALSALARELQSFAQFEVTVDQIPAILAEVEMYQKQAAEIEAKKNQLPFEWKQILEKYSTEADLQQYKAEIKQQMAISADFSNVLIKLKREGTLSNSIDNAKAVICDFDILHEKENAVCELLLIKYDDNDVNWIDNRESLCDCLLDNAAIIKDWIVYKQFDSICRQDGLGVVCDAYEEGLPHEQVKDVYLRSIYKAIVLSVIESEPVLNSFTGNGFNERINQFKKLDKEFMEHTKDEMFYQLTHNLPAEYGDMEISRELHILRRAISSNGRGMSIRSLFDQIPHVLMKLTPCMLMSPISVAQYLSAENELYDIVIFDEASQLPTCKAVGVLARGENAVIVGDPNQMPPTSFFAGNTVDEDNLEIEDLDSILDDCLALGMPSAHLQWHYRSRHESLIAFSNHEFYENSMLTFPSVNDREKRVSMVKVDSFFDRKKGRINEGEAKEIIKEIKRRYKDPERKFESIGVVTFNISQQTLIEDMLQEEFAKDQDFDNWASTGEEPLFVKNLENVQGDERDVIMFSVAFGPNEEGKLSLNFGPINKEGGWKRLNVAVSRARLEMLVFSTMTADMIDLKRTKSKGVESLKNFLEFAEKGKLQMSYSEMHTEKYQGIMDCICAELDKAGYKYQKAVGHSKFKVDIAVINPYNEDEYLAGIMLDGESYRQSSNTKDREVAQIGVLGGLGWKLHRMWTMDWWDNKQKEIDKLLAVLDEAKKDAESGKKNVEEKPKMDVLGVPTVEVDKPVIEIESEVLDAPETSESQVVEMPKTVVEPEPIVTFIEPETKIASVGTESFKFDFENAHTEADASKFADSSDEVQSAVKMAEPLEYSIVDYVEAELDLTPASTAEYNHMSNFESLVAKLQKIVDVESPVSADRLIKRALRSYDIGRSSSGTIATTEMALKKVNAKHFKQNGKKFYVREGQDIDSYSEYRNDTANTERRLPEEVCLQELKNAVCVTLIKHGPMPKDNLVRETIRMMGFARCGATLVEVVEDGLKYGVKTGEILKGDLVYSIRRDY